MARSTSLPHRRVVQAKALLMAGDAGVGVIAKGRGRKSSLPPGTVAEALRLTQHELPADGSTQWSTRTMAARVGIGKDAVARIWADHGLKPWKTDTFKISNDSLFEQKLVDVVGL